MSDRLPDHALSVDSVLTSTGIDGVDANVGLDHEDTWANRSSLLAEAEQYMMATSTASLPLSGGRGSLFLPHVANDSTPLTPLNTQNSQILEKFLEELECEDHNSSFQELLAAHLNEMQQALATRIDRMQLLVKHRLGTVHLSAQSVGSADFEAPGGSHTESSNHVFGKLEVETFGSESPESPSEPRPPPPNASRPMPSSPPPKSSLKSGVTADGGSTAPLSAIAGMSLVTAPVPPNCPPVFSLHAAPEGDPESSSVEAKAPTVDKKLSFDSTMTPKGALVKHGAKISFSDHPLLPEDEPVRESGLWSQLHSDISNYSSKQLGGVSFKETDSVDSSDAGRDSKDKSPKVNNSASMRSNTSSEDMNFTFELLPMWHRHHIKQLTGTRVGHRSFRGGMTKSLELSGLATDPENASEVDFDLAELKRTQSIWYKMRQFRCLLPNSVARGVWDCMSCFLVFYDMVMIPLELLDPEEIPFAYGMAWVTRLFWTFDMPASLSTGYLKPDGVVERRFSQVARRYLRTWFLFDIMMVSVEWLELIWSASSSMGFLRFGRTSRAFRIIRMVRLLRLIRIREILVVIAERVRSERLIIAADVVKIMLVVVSFAHVIACIWFGIGNSESNDTNWVRTFGIKDAPFIQRYACSMHWSLSQFSGGMDEIRPANTGERVFTIFVFLFAFLMASTLISRLTSSMTRLHMLSNTQAQQLVALRKYLAENGINQSVALRLQKNAQHAIAEQQRFMPESKVELLHLVSEPLLMELHFELYHQVMSLHPFFGRYMEECCHVMRKVCHLAVSLVQFGAGDVVFSAGEIPLIPKMYFVNTGALTYESPFQSFEASMPVISGQWVSEMTLWTNWMHRGTFTCSGNSRLSVLDAAKFQDIVGRFEHPPTFEPRLYAWHFVNELNSTEGDITDLSVVAFPLALLKRRASRVKGRAAADAPVSMFNNLFNVMQRTKTQVTGTYSDKPAPTPLPRSMTQREGGLGKVLPEVVKPPRRSMTP